MKGIKTFEHISQSSSHHHIPFYYTKKEIPAHLNGIRGEKRRQGI